MSEPSQEIVSSPKSEIKPKDTYEKIQPEVLRRSAEKYKKFYNIPDSVVARINATEASRLKEDQLIEGHIDRLNKQIAEIDRICSFVEEVNQNQDFSYLLLDQEKREELLATKQKLLDEIKDRSFLEEVQATEGEFVMSIKGEREILIKQGLEAKEEEALDHEVLHALSSDSFYTGGLEYRTGGEIKYTELNEIATELLRIAEKHPELTILDLYKKFISGELRGFYGKGEKLLSVMALTQVNGVPFTIQNLAEYYFGFGEGEGFTDRGSMVTGLLPLLISKTGDKGGGEDAERIMESMK